MATCQGTESDFLENIKYLESDDVPLLLSEMRAHAARERRKLQMQ